MARLEPVLFEIERQRSPILLIAHQAVLRCLFSYFLDVDLEEIPHIAIKMNSVYELIPRAYGNKIK